MPQRTNPPPSVAMVDLLAQYELLQSLGGSERASVHRARDRVLGQVVAIKLLREERGHDPDRVARYYRLARAAASLGHPNIVATYDHGSAWRTAFITMEYVAGRDFAALLDQEGALPPRRAAAIVVQLLDALTAAYGAGLIHGDLHPRNVLLREGTDAVVLTDFGMASLLGPPSPRQRETPANATYRAPELAQGAPTSPAADIYAVGALLQAALTAPPTRPGLATRQSAALTAALLEIAQRALDPDPAARYPSAEIMRADLLAVAGPLTLPVIAPAPAPAPQHGHGAAPAIVRAEQAPRPHPSRRTAALLLGGGLVLAALVGGTALVRSMQPAAAPSPTVAALVLPSATAVPLVPTAPPAALATTTTTATAPATAVPVIPTTAPPPAAAATVAAPTPQPTTAPPTSTVVAPTPTTATSPTPTANPTPTAAAAITYTNTFAPDEFQGAYRREDGTLYGRQTIALYGVGTGYDRGTLTFEVAAQPTGPLTLILTGLDDELAAHCVLSVTINGVTIFTGPTTLPNTPETDHGVGGADRYWGQMAIAVPTGTLRAGTNTLTLQNTEPSTTLGVPYILINSVVFEATR